MMNIKSSLFLAVFITFSSYIQWHLPIHGDVGYLTYISHLMLHGATYSKPFYETNPPMILYLYLPVAILTDYFSVSLLLKIYVTLLAMLSVVLSNYMLDKLIANSKVRYTTLLGILFSLIIIPASQYGQREHLFLILSLPYLFSLSCLLEKKQLNVYLLLLIGLLASLGFCIKPYFVYIYLFVNTYVIYRTKQLSKLFYLPTLLIGIALPTYLISTYLFFPEYFTLILPLVYQFYLDAISEPWIAILTNPLVLFCLSVLIIYILLSNIDEHPAIGITLAFSLAGGILAFLDTKTTWFYHLIPAMGLAFILLSFYLGQLFTTNSLTIKILCLLVLIPLLLPMLNIVTIITMHSKTSSNLNTITQFINSANEPRSISCFSVATTRDCFPLTTNTHSRYGTRYPFFWWIRGLIQSPNPNAYLFLTNTVADDLDHYQPRWVLINSLHAKRIIGNNFDFISFFSDNQHFREAWKHYHLVKKEGQYDLFERLPDA